MDFQDFLCGADCHEYLEHRHGGVRCGAECGRFIISNAGIDISGVVGDLETQLADWSMGALLGLWFQSVFVGLCTPMFSVFIFLVIYGRMIEVYLVTSIGPISFATMVNREWGSARQNYLRSLLALGFRALSSL